MQTNLKTPMDQTNQQSQEQTVTMNIPIEEPVQVNEATIPTPPETQTPPKETPLVVPEVVPVEKPKSNAGRPCEFCSDKENILRLTQEYLDSGSDENKPKMLYLNELALFRLKKHRETIMEWAKKKQDDGSLEHPEFSDMIKSIEQSQELRLQQRVLGRYNPTGAIFLLKTKHGYMEAEKRVIAGDQQEPLTIEIVEAKHNVEE